MFRPKIEGRSLLYRFESEGIIVYDSKARISDQEAEIPAEPPLTPKSISQYVQKEISTAKEYGDL